MYCQNKNQIKEPKGGSDNHIENGSPRISVVLIVHLSRK